MESKALKVTKAVQASLEKITIAEGFETDAGLSITRGRRRISPEENFPLLVIHEGKEEVVGKRGDTVVHLRLPITIEGFLAVDAMNPLDSSHQLLADIKRSLYPSLSSHRGLIIQSEYLGREIIPPEDGSSYSSVSVHLAVEWGEELSNPY